MNRPAIITKSAHRFRQYMAAGATVAQREYIISTNENIRKDRHRTCWYSSYSGVTARTIMMIPR